MDVNKTGSWTPSTQFAIEDPAVRTSNDELTRYLGGWIEDGGRNPMINSNGNETRGNATVFSYYKIVGDICFWMGQYTIGNTTSWAGGGNPICLVPPVPYWTSNMGGSWPIAGHIRGYNGTFQQGVVEAGAFVAGVFCCFDMAIGNSTWNVTAARPFAWTTGGILGWNLEYRIDEKYLLR